MRTPLTASSPGTAPLSPSPWGARLLCMPLFVAYAVLAVLALGAQPRVSDDVLWAGWFFVRVIAPVAALRGLSLLGSRMLKDRTHRAHQSMVDVGLCALTTLGLIAQFWLIAAA